MKRANADLERQPKSFRGNRDHLRRFIDALPGPDVKAWNDWRKNHPTVRPDLRGLDLTLLNQSESVLQLKSMSAILFFP